MPDPEGGTAKTAKSFHSKKNPIHFKKLDPNYALKALQEKTSPISC